MKVLLKGIGGVYNYGCEAIVRGTVNILRSIDENVEIDCASRRIEDDKKRLKDCNVNIISEYNRWYYKNIIKGILNRLHIKNNICCENFSKIKKYDAVLSIGGDIYTIWPNGEYAKPLVDFGNECTRRNIPYIMWGCSIGPFEKDKNIKDIFTDHLSKLPMIVAREDTTIKYLDTIGIKDNVKFMFDPAYFVPSGEQKPAGKKINNIGINLSPLSLSFLHMDEEKTIKLHKDTIEKIIKELDTDIILLPHVVETEESDNDFTYLNKIYNSIDEKLKKRIYIVNDDPGFVGIKEHIKKCDIVISARMHCCINSICCGVPTIFLSYSEKSKGMCRLVFGNDKNCIGLENFTPEKIISIINDAEKEFKPINTVIPETIKKFFTNLK